MPVLELTPEKIGPSRDRLTLAYIEGVMLWPSDPIRRAEVWKSCQAAFLRDSLLAEARVAPHGFSPVSTSDWADAFALAADAQPLASIQCETEFSWGLTAANILFWTLNAANGGAERNLEGVKSDIIGEFRGQLPVGSMSPKTVQRYWDRYKVVSHLWAAFLFMHSESQEPFPCALDHLEVFLGIAEQLRVDAEKIRTGNGGTLLPEATTWRLPETLNIPLLRIPWEHWRWGAPSAEGAEKLFSSD